jgi:choline monooxygenase
VHASRFPSARDHLPRVPFGEWKGHGFAALDPIAPLEVFLADIAARLDWLPLDECELDPALSRDYEFDAHWAQAAFDLPSSSPEHGQRIAAYYWWIFPNLMLNFYPWGLSVNLVQPLGISRTRVQFRSFVRDRALLGQGAGGALDEVEMEDEAVVQTVQRGLRSRFYSKGRYSPTREQGVHHFHRLIGEFLGASA